MIEIYCVIEDPAEDDFVCPLRKTESGAWIHKVAQVEQ